MFSLWPELFAYQMIAVTLLRVTTGYLFLVLGVRCLQAHLRYPSPSRWVRGAGLALGVAQILVGGLLVVGFYLQPTTLAGAVLATLPTLTGRRLKVSEQQVYLLLFVLSLSLLFLGPGLFAIDIPL